MMPRLLITAVRHLADILDLENDALKAMDLRRAAGLLPEKAAALTDLNLAGELPAGPMHPALASTAGRLNGLMLENRRLLERAIVAQQRVIGIVVRAAAATDRAEPVYGARGRRMRVTGPMALSTRA
jgi:hypothetical protein